MKKVLRYVFLLVLCSVLVSPVYAVESCMVDANNNIKGCISALGRNVQIDAKIAQTVHVVVLVIQIAVPIILVVFGMIDLAKAVIASKEDEIKKSQMTFIKRLIAGALVFFVFAIVKMVISFVATNSTDMLNCVNCFINGTVEAEKADEEVEQSENK